MSKKNYGAESIKVLKGLEAVRVRPGMYAGDVTTHDGLFTILREVIDNAIDEHLAGHCDTITVTIHDNHFASVTDNGRGIPVDMHKDTGISAAETIMTTLHAGGKFDQDSYKVSGGLHGVGVSVTNALSEEVILTVDRDKKRWEARFAKGEITQPLKKIKSYRSDDFPTGTTVTFKPDTSIFTDTKYDLKVIEDYMRQSAFLNKGLTCKFISERSDNQFTKTYRYDGGLAEYGKYLTQNKTLITKKPCYVHGTKDGIEVEAVLLWCDGYSETIKAFTNNVPQGDFGTHVAGLKSALTRRISKYIIDNNILRGKKAVEVGADDIREGFVGAIAVRMPDPKFSSQTKDKLVSSEVKPIVESIVGDALTSWLDENKSVAKAIIDKISQAARAREEAKKARDLVRRKNEIDSVTTLPGKLADCRSKDASVSEIFIVEGDSASGSAKQARDRMTQAILPLRGKILNVERKNLSEALQNEQISNIVAALGCSIGSDYDARKLRYQKIIVMADADVDGMHISCLLLTFFYRHMPQVIRDGYLFIAKPPLYRVFKGKTETYCWTDAERDRASGGTGAIQRFKGLGEMNPEQLWNTTLNPKTRKLMKVNISDAALADEMIASLMGKNVGERKDMIEAKTVLLDELDV